MKWSATIRADLENRGKPIGPYDVLIAGTALAIMDVPISKVLFVIALFSSPPFSFDL
jgi:hypothetical protein